MREQVALSWDLGLRLWECALCTISHSPPSVAGFREGVRLQGYLHYSAEWQRTGPREKMVSRCEVEFRATVTPLLLLLLLLTERSGSACACCNGENRDKEKPRTEEKEKALHCGGEGEELKPVEGKRSDGDGGGGKNEVEAERKAGPLRWTQARRSNWESQTAGGCFTLFLASSRVVNHYMEPCATATITANI